MHLYKVGQILELRSDPRHSNRPAGTCEVTNCLPHETGPVLYRVKSWNERIERVVEEVDLSPSESRKSAATAPERVFDIAVSKK